MNCSPLPTLHFKFPKLFILISQALYDLYYEIICNLAEPMIFNIWPKESCTSNTQSHSQRNAASIRRLHGDCVPLIQDEESPY